MDIFKTIKNNNSAKITVKKSIFIADIFYVESQNEVKKYIDETKNKYKQAKHYCYGYNIISTNVNISKYSDDGEPTGTAGVPILNCIIKNDLINVLVIVTRYFGGTLLGTGGLVKAYTDVTLKVLEDIQIINKVKGYVIKLTINYNNLQKFMYFCKKASIKIENIKYSDNIEMEIEISEYLKEIIFANNNNIDFNFINYTILRQKYIDANIIE